MQNSPFDLFNLPSAQQVEGIQRGFIARVYAWMTGGLLITAFTSLMMFMFPALLLTVLRTNFLFFGLLIAELGLVLVLSRLIHKMPAWVAGMLFAGYAMLNGVTLTVVLLAYTGSSVAIVFGITACSFGIMTLWGFTTHRDLTGMGNLLLMALVGLVLTSLINMFLGSSTVNWIVSLVGVVVFIGLIAYDTQKLKRMSLGLSEDGEVVQSASILGALSLYLDFINLFLFLLRLIGRRR